MISHNEFLWIYIIAFYLVTLDWFVGDCYARLIYIIRWTNQFEISLKNTYCIKLKDLKVTIAHINKLMNNIISPFSILCLYLIYIVYFILMYYVIFILTTIFITKLFYVVNIKIILSNKIN